MKLPEITQSVRRYSPFAIIVLALISAAVSLALGFLPGKRQMMNMFQQSGYSLVFAAFFLWAHAMLPRVWNGAASAAWTSAAGAAWNARFRRHWPGLLLALLITATGLAASGPRFRVLADETNLMAISMAIHDTKQFHNPTEGYHFFEAFTPNNTVYGKRPIGYPFIVSLAHTALGYSAYNGMVVNALAGFLCLFLFWLLLGRFFPPLLAGMGVVVLGSYPIYAQWVASSGFEIVNLLFLLLAFLLLERWVRLRQVADLERLAVTAVILSQVRYESAMYVVLLALASLVHFRSEHFRQLSLRIALIPPLFLPVVWQRILNIDDKYQLAEGEAPFSGEWFLKNLINAFKFLSGEEAKYGTMPAVFWLALAALPVVALELAVRRRAVGARALTVAAAAAASTLALMVVVFSYYWGDLTLQYASRIGIPFLPVLVVLAVYFVSRAALLPVLMRPASEVDSVKAVPPEQSGAEGETRASAMNAADRIAAAFSGAVAASGANNPVVRLALVGTLALWAYHMPQAGLNSSVREIHLYREYSLVLDYLEKNFPSRDNIIVLERPGMYTPHRWGAVSFESSSSNHREIQFFLKRNLIQDVVVVQKIMYSDEKPTSSTKMANLYQLETLAEFQVAATHYMRISKVVRPCEDLSKNWPRSCAK